jgi:hypothetical protein
VWWARQSFLGWRVDDVGKTDKNEKNDADCRSCGPKDPGPLSVFEKTDKNPTDRHFDSLDPQPCAERRRRRCALEAK